MNFKALAIAVLAAGSCTLAYGKTAENTATVTVCLEDPSGDPTIEQARTQASAMFRTADLTIVWRHSAAACRKPGVQGIIIDLLNQAPQDAPRLTMARAFPYEGVHIQIFCNRVSHRAGGLDPVLFAHVLVHEITHILQGIDRHSETGIMKAAWTPQDYSRMRIQPLPFTAYDIELIHLGMLNRNLDTPANSPLARNMSATNPAQTR